MLYLGLLLLGSRGVGGERGAFLDGRRGEGSLLEQLPLPQQAGVHGSDTGKGDRKVSAPLNYLGAEISVYHGIC